MYVSNNGNNEKRRNAIFMIEIISKHLYSSTPGHYNCLCSEKYYGQNCSIEAEKNKKYFGEIHLLYNHIAHITGDNYFLIILTDLGSVPSMLEMVTSEYAIVGGLTFSSDNAKNLIKTNDIKTVAKTFSLPASSFLPNGTVFYYVGKYRMAVDGIALVMLTVSDEVAVYYIWYFQFGSIRNYGCNPMVKVSNW